MLGVKSNPLTEKYNLMLIDYFYDGKFSLEKQNKIEDDIEETGKAILKEQPNSIKWSIGSVPPFWFLFSVLEKLKKTHEIKWESFEKNNDIEIKIELNKKQLSVKFSELSPDNSIEHFANPYKFCLFHLLCKALRYINFKQFQELKQYNLCEKIKESKKTFILSALNFDYIFHIASEKNISYKIYDVESLYIKYYNNQFIPLPTINQGSNDNFSPDDICCCKEKSPYENIKKWESSTYTNIELISIEKIKEKNKKTKLIEVVKKRTYLSKNNELIKEEFLIENNSKFKYFPSSNETSSYVFERYKRFEFTNPEEYNELLFPLKSDIIDIIKDNIKRVYIDISETMGYSFLNIIINNSIYEKNINVNTFNDNFKNIMISELSCDIPKLLKEYGKIKNDNINKTILKFSFKNIDEKKDNKQNKLKYKNCRAVTENNQSINYEENIFTPLRELSNTIEPITEE